MFLTLFLAISVLNFRKVEFLLRNFGTLLSAIMDLSPTPYMLPVHRGISEMFSAY